MKVAASFDHRGVKLRDAVFGAIADAGHEAIDLGVDTDAVRVDYPDRARVVGEAILRGAAGGRARLRVGVGASVAACKIDGIRAAICHDSYSAHQGVEHDDMNVLCLGSEIVGESLARSCDASFLRAEFAAKGVISNGSESGKRWKRRVGMAQSRLHELSEHGVSVWFDTLGRELLETGELERMMRDDAVVGVTSNPTIFQKALSEGDWYDAQLREVVRHETDPREIFFALAVQDIKAACDLLRPVWETRRVSTATSRSRSTPASPTTATRPSSRRSGCTGSSIGRTAT